MNSLQVDLLTGQSLDSSDALLEALLLSVVRLLIHLHLLQLGFLQVKISLQLLILMLVLFNFDGTSLLDLVHLGVQLSKLAAQNVSSSAQNLK